MRSFTCLIVAFLLCAYCNLFYLSPVVDAAISRSDEKSARCVSTVLAETTKKKEIGKNKKEHFREATRQESAWVQELCSMRYFFVGGFQVDNGGVGQDEGQHMQTVFPQDGRRKRNPMRECGCSTPGCWYYCPKVQANIASNPRNRENLYEDWFASQPI
ncbi:unnamed protein product [Phaeothamnion confervicola]